MPVQLRDTLKAGGYKKHSAFINVAETFYYTQPYWSGGSKDDYFALCVINGARQGIYVQQSTPWPEPPSSEKIVMVDGKLYVRGGIFRGKDAHWSVHMTAATAKLIGLPDDFKDVT